MNVGHRRPGRCRVVCTRGRGCRFPSATGGVTEAKRIEQGPWGKEVGKVKENYGEGKWLPDSTARLLKVCSVWLATGGGVRPGWMQAYFSGDVRPLCRWGSIPPSLCFQLWATASCSDSS